MNLHSKHLKTLQTLFSKHPTIAQALLFGSRALGTHKESSDIDIALKGDITPTLLAHLKEELEDSTLPYFCDILDYERAPQELKEHIDTHALTLYKREEEWQEVRLGDVVEIVNGYAFKSKDFLSAKTDNALPIIKIKNVANGDVNLDDVQYHYYDSKLHRYVIRKTDILISLTGNHPHANTQVVGKVSRYKLEQEALLNQRVANIYPKENIDKDFLYYFLKLDSTHQELASKSSGSGNQANISKSDIESLIIPLPPLERQKEIAEILSSFDDKIDFLHRQNRTLESLAQTLFRYYFIENAKEEWGEGSLFEWIEDTLGGDWGKEFPNKDFNKQVVCFRGTDIADLNNGLPTKIPLRYIKETKLKKIEPKNGDIIFEISGGTETQSTGRATYINENVKALFNPPIVFSNFCRLLVIKNENYSFFLYLYLRYLYENNEFFAYENGSSGIKNLDYRGLLNDNLVKIPPQKEIINFNNEVKEYFYKIDKNKKEIQRLKFLVDQSLLLLDSGNK